MIHELAVARENEYTVEEVDLAIHAHPTLSEAIAEAALDSMGRVHPYLSPSTSTPRPRPRTSFPSPGPPSAGASCSAPAALAVILLGVRALVATAPPSPQPDPTAPAGLRAGLRHHRHLHRGGHGLLRRALPPAHLPPRRTRMVTAFAVFVAGLLLAPVNAWFGPAGLGGVALVASVGAWASWRAGCGASGRPMSVRPLLVTDLGDVPYGEVLELQRRLCRRRQSGRPGRGPAALCRAPPVVTLGRGTRDVEPPLPPDAARATRGVEVFEVERGGDVTFHGPGQLVGYPILDLAQHRQDLHWYLRAARGGADRRARHARHPAERKAGYTGVWTGGRKIASIGIHVKQWVTLHGFALNVTTDLSLFDLIVPVRDSRA